MKRAFIIVLDSFGIGNAPDASRFGDEGSNTLKSISTSEEFNAENLIRLGLGNIDGVDFLNSAEKPLGSYGRIRELSNGKDTTVGHWEIAGIISDNPLPTYPKGFPKEIIEEFERRTGKKVLCNKPYSGTDVIRDYGKEHIKTGDLIVYTSADSVFQIAAHEKIVPVEKLYEYCETAREILKGKHGVGRVIARPFIGKDGDFTRTANRHDFSLNPPKKTVLDALCEHGKATIGVGKINDIFNGQGITESYKTTSNENGMEISLNLLDKEFEGLCFINLVDFDSKYGHRNDVDGYAKAIAVFDKWLPSFLNGLKDEDIVIITADHGCDPLTPSTDHSRECVPVLIYGKPIKSVNLGTLESFSSIAATVRDYFGIEFETVGKSFLDIIGK